MGFQDIFSRERSKSAFWLLENPARSLKVIDTRKELARFSAGVNFDFSLVSLALFLTSKLLWLSSKL